MTSQSDQAHLRSDLRAIEEMARECHACITYLVQERHGLSERYLSRLDAIAHLARDGIRTIRDLRRDLDTLAKVQATADLYVAALEELRRRHDPQQPLEALVRRARPPALALEGTAQRLKHQIPQQPLGLGLGQHAL